LIKASDNHSLLVYAGRVNLLDENMNVTKALLDATKEDGIKVKYEEAK
jgi:hypothetical protein